LSFRLDSGGNIERFLQDSCHVDPDTAGLLINGHVFPNPLLYARRPEIWGKARSIDIATGFIHGDLNTNNILVKFSDDKQTLEGYYLIDFALFKDQMPLLYDHAPMLELRAAIGLSRLCQEQGDNERARKVLSEAYSKITEGFATHDLKEATTLLADSSEPPLNSRGDRD
jgi:hypothetical protein